MSDVTASSKGHPRTIKCLECGGPAKLQDRHKNSAPGTFEPLGHASQKPSLFAARYSIVSYTYVCDNKHKFKTYEVYSATAKRKNIERKEVETNGAKRVEPFDLATLIASLQKAAPRTHEKDLYKVACLAEALLDELPGDGNIGGIPIYKSDQVGECALQALLLSDMIVPWTRYCMVFHSLDRIKSFGELLAELRRLYMASEKTLMDLAEVSVADKDLVKSWEEVRKLIFDHRSRAAIARGARQRRDKRLN